MSGESIVPGFDDLLEKRRAEKAEALRFTRAGLGVHDSELIYVDDVDAAMTRIAGPNWREV